MADISVLLLTAGYAPGYRYGGPIRTLVNMVESLGEEINFRVICNDRDLGESAPYEGVLNRLWTKVGRADVCYLDRSVSGMWWYAKFLISSRASVIHINSFFSFLFSIFPLMLLRFLGSRRSIVLGPRGEFAEAALNLKRRKKAAFIFVFKLLGLQKFVLWHASSEHEARDIRRVMGGQVRIRTAVDIALPEQGLALKPRVCGKPLRIVFLSRISPMKNLLGVLNVLRCVSCPIVLDIFGPQEDQAYWKECHAAMLLLPEHVHASYLGSLRPLEVPKCLASYDLFFLPTLGENFGHAIAEALFAGVPLLISDRTPWRDLERRGLGWDIPLHQDARFIAGIETCFRMSAKEYNIWRARIRAWATENIGNPEAIEQNRQLFLNVDELYEH
ncbi:glycosyltransferase [Variovorax paradoxus]|uniref:glycosyltransferase n=1 Tax=Variovorax paradoxus TaxID=34073 RepID=UPI0009B7BC49|nr:glycosyltransferase [Variovorax paradoxus]